MMDYSLCDQTVTVYHKEKGGVSRQVLAGCHWERSRVQEAREMGVRNETKFLLIVPGKVQQLFPGDKVFFGVGPEISLEEWAGFCAARCPEVGEVAYATPCFWDGRLCHVEAGRK